jgi:hypothetical protein
MANCTYTFTGGTSIKGIPALKAFLLKGGLDTYLPERAMEMQGPSASARQTDTPAFKKWFGDSEVVDKSGEPLVVYHGSLSKGVTVFDTSRVTTRNPKGDLAGTYFTSNPQTAYGYTREFGVPAKTPRGDVTAVYLKIENPLNTTAAIKKYRKQGLSFGDAKRKALEALTPEHDGVIFDGDKANASEYVVFKPTQIKSATSNTGAFDPENPDIRFSRAQPLTPADVLKPETIAKAEAAIAQYKKAEPPDPLTTKQRADGEQLLEPVFEAARRNKDAFDATLDRIGESVNGFAKKPAIKKPYRAVTKLVLENDGDVEGMKDLLRGTIVVNSLEDVQDTIDKIGKVYGFDRIKNRLLISVTNAKGETVEGKPLYTGYQDVLTNVVLPDGTIAEIQISTPEMVAAKSLGHQIFSFEREMPESPVKSRMVEIQKQIYAEGLGAYERRAANALKTLSNSASSTGSPFSRTSEGLRGLGSGTQAVAERQFGETVTGTSFQSKNMVPGGKDLKSNFIRTSDPIIPESIGINVNQDGTNQYADKIVDGKKTLETRASDSLRPYVGKRVAIVRTGDGPAKAIGAVTIGEPIRVSTQKQFDQYRNQTLVPKDSKFDIAPGGVKYLYPVENPVRYATELDVGLGIVARKVIAPSLSRREQKNAAASRVEGTSEDRFKRTPALQQAVVDLQEGKITRDEYNRMVDEMRPVYPYKEVPAITTPKDARYALENGRGQSPEKAAKYGRPSMTLIKGDWAQLRLDIPSYQEHDAWVVSVHTPKSTNREVQAAYDAGPVVGYESVAAMTDVTFGMNQKAAAKIAAGSSKGTIATMLGKWSPISKADAKARAEAAMKDKAWTQVGMDPFRHSYFYDRDSMRPVLSADEVIQIGPLVLAKNVKFGEDTDITGAEIAFSARQFRSAQGQRFTLQDETYTKTVQRNLQDYFARVADVQEALSAQGGVVGEAQNVYLAEELSYGRLQEQMVDFKEDMLKPLIKATKAAGLELSDLALYAYAKHAPERNQAIAARNKTFGKGEGSGMTTSEANNIMRAFKADGKDQDLASLHDQLMQITQVTRLVLLSEGLITQDQFDALQRQYADYVPLRGFVEDEDLESGRPVSGPRVGGRGFNIRGKETMRALGRESRAGHIIENIVIDYERAIARSERNTVAKVFLDLATTNPDPGLWEIDTVRTKAAFDRATGMVKYNTLIDKGEDTISVKIEGKEIYIKIKDPLLLRAMRAAGKDETGAIDRVLAMTVGRYTALMRNTLTRYNPAFGFTNAVKDLGFGAVSALSDLGPKGTALFFKNYANPVQSGQMFEEFRAAGATTGGWHIRDQQEMQKELQRLVEWEGGSSIKSTAYSMGKATLDALEFIGQYSETQARFAAYKAARQLNKSPAEAASIAKNLTTNFNRKGEWGSAMNTMYLFFNAGVQGSVKTLKNLRSPYVVAAMAGLSGLAAGLAFMGAGVGGDDDDGEAYWDKIPQFEKERNLILMLPPGEGMMVKGESKVGKNGRYFKLPIQYGINVFSTLGYQIADLARYTLDHSRGVSPAKAATNMVSVTFGSFNPFGGGFDPSKPAEVALAVSPSIVDLGVQALMGVNSFGTPVAPRKYDDIKPDAENFGPGMAGTWEQRLARWLSESTGGDRAVGGAIDVSPGSIRNIVRNLTGGTGDFLTSVFVNIPSKMWSPEGEVGPRDVPVLKAFYGEVDEVTDSKLFYERKAEVLEAAKQAANQQKLGIKVEYDDKSKGLQSLSKSAEKYTKKMTELRKKELKTAEDSNLTETQKTRERKDIQKERAQIASEFNALYYEMKKDLSRK